MSHHGLLLVDCGNSTVKSQVLRIPSDALEDPAILWDQVRTTDTDRMDNAHVSADALAAQWRTRGASIFAADSASAPTRWQMVWSSVGPMAAQQAVCDAFRQLTGRDAPPPVRPTPCLALRGIGISRYENRYTQPEQLGVDRWLSGLGLIGQMTRTPGDTHLVVSAGTATTIDLIRIDGLDQMSFRGGWIFPGIGLMNAALREHTRDLHAWVDVSRDMSDSNVAVMALNSLGAIPLDSRSAISHGIALAQTGGISALVRHHQVSHVWVHGGYATQWRTYFSAFAGDFRTSVSIHAIPHLVLLGLVTLQNYRV